MKSLIKIKFLSWAVMVILLMLPTSRIKAQVKVNLAGKMLIEVTDAKMNLIGDAPNHQFMIVDFVGTNYSMEPSGFMDSSQVEVYVFEDRIYSNNEGGIQQGYVKFSTLEDTVYATFNGNVEFILTDTELIAQLQSKKFIASPYTHRGYSWNQYPSSSSNGMEPVFCDICGQHLPLYVSNNLMVCKDCIPFADYEEDYSWLV